MSKQTPEDLLGFDGGQAAGEFDGPPAIAKPASPSSKKKYLRRDEWSMDVMTDDRKLLTWINQAMDVPLETVDMHIVNKSYPAIIWLFRKAAIEGNLKQTKALEMWLNWAKPIVARPPMPAEATPSTGSLAFSLREPDPQEESE
jgi:hypothetical protein